MLEPLNLDVLANGGRFGNGLLGSPHSFEVEGKGFSNEFFHFAQGFPHGHATGKVRNRGAITFGALLYYDGVFHPTSSSICACRKILLSVPGGTSTLGFPATVTV